jgi:hypothetical protein
MSPEGALALYRAVADRSRPRSVSEASARAGRAGDRGPRFDQDTGRGRGARDRCGAGGQRRKWHVTAPAAGEARAFAYGCVRTRRGTLRFPIPRSPNLGIREVAFANGTREHQADRLPARLDRVPDARRVWRAGVPRRQAGADADAGAGVARGRPSQRMARTSCAGCWPGGRCRSGGVPATKRWRPWARPTPVDLELQLKLLARTA